MMIFQCTRCSFRSEDKLSFIRHTFESHSSEVNFKHTCGINGCPRTFSRYSSFLSHANRQHHNWRQQWDGRGLNVAVTTEMVESNPDAPGPTMNEDDTLSTEHDEDLHDEDFTPQQALHKMAALFLLTLKEKYKLTQSAVNFATDAVKNMFSVAQHQGTLGQLNPFEGLETEHLQMKFYRSHFNLIVS